MTAETLAAEQAAREKLARAESEMARETRLNLEALTRLCQHPDFHDRFLNGYLAALEKHWLESMSTSADAMLPKVRERWNQIREMRADIAGKPAELAALNLAEESTHPKTLPKG